MLLPHPIPSSPNVFVDVATVQLLCTTLLYLGFGGVSEYNFFFPAEGVEVPPVENISVIVKLLKLQLQ